ncbi:hypothetical protein [Novipirellula rosea]|uniref:Uncharacterized protein n=1 Tax=Novipirellula rosea TaxID=1031540 RepID=A0ABP8MFP2_9BACT
MKNKNEMRGVEPGSMSSWGQFSTAKQVHNALLWLNLAHPWARSEWNTANEEANSSRGVEKDFTFSESLTLNLPVATTLQIGLLVHSVATRLAITPA